MKRISILLLLFFIASCTYNKGNNVESKASVKKTEREIYDKLDDYFSDIEIKPSIIINNTEGNQTDIRLAKHRIKWFGKEGETKIKIDGDLFSLKDKITLNTVSDSKDSVDGVNSWDEIKLFKFGEKEIIGIRMSYEPCTGLGCGAFYYLVYDVSTKTKNFFGTFRSDDRLALYNVVGAEDRIDYISKTFSGIPHDTRPISILYNLYSMNDKGQFIQQNDKSGAPYQLTLRMLSDEEDDTARIDAFEQHWPTQIK